jgi:hypothetical protein
MLNFNFIVTTTIIILGSFLAQQSASAYPKASEKSEISYLKSIVISMYGQSAPLSSIDRYVEEEYRNKSDNVQGTLIDGYKICDDVRAANQKGISGQVLLTQEILNLNGKTLPMTGRVLTKELLIEFYNNATNNLCPGIN